MSSKFTGRPKGKGNLSDAVKIGIIGAKKLQLMSQAMIAEQFDVARYTVNRLSEDDLSEDGKAQLLNFTDKLSQIRDKTANLLIKKLDNGTIKDGVLPTLLNVANQNYRLETGQPTVVINEQKNDAVANALSRLIQQKRELAAQTNQPFPTEDQLIHLIQTACKANDVDADYVRERVLNADSNVTLP